MNFGQAVSYIADRYGWDVFPLTENSDIGKNDVETARAVRTVLKGTQNGRKADYVTDEELKQRLVKTTKLTDLARKYGFTTAEFKAFLKKRGKTVPRTLSGLRNFQDFASKDTRNGKLPPSIIFPSGV